MPSVNARWIPYAGVYESAKFAACSSGCATSACPAGSCRASGASRRARTFRPAGPTRTPSEPSPGWRQPDDDEVVVRHHRRRAEARRETGLALGVGDGVADAEASREGGPGPPARIAAACPRAAAIDEAELSLAEGGQRRPTQEVRHRKVQAPVADEPLEVRAVLPVELPPERDGAPETAAARGSACTTRSGSRSPTEARARTTNASTKAPTQAPWAPPL